MCPNTSQTTHLTSDQFDNELHIFHEEIYKVKGTGKLLMDFKLSGSHESVGFNIGEPVFKKEIPIKRNKSNTQKIITKRSKSSTNNLF